MRHSKTVLLGVMGLAGIVRLILSGVLGGTGQFDNVPHWFAEELPPLIGLLVGSPIESIDPRQFGVPVFLVIEPILRLARGDLVVVQRALLVVAVACSAIAFMLDWRHARGASRNERLMRAALWLSWTPLILVIAERSVDTWQLLFVTASIVLITGSPRVRLFAGVPLAFATLTKLLPGVLFVYLAIRNWRAAVLGAWTGAVLLAVGQVLYGPLLGLGYPAALLYAGGGTVERWSVHQENNSARGLVYKVASGFRWDESAQAVARPSQEALVSATAYLISFALVALLVVVSWRGRRDLSWHRVSLGFAIGIATMLLASPHTAHEYMVLTLPVFGVLIPLWREGYPERWGRGQLVAAAIAAALLGVLIPMSLMARIIPLGTLAALTGNAGHAFFAQANQGPYGFFGFPGYGLVILWALLLALELKTWRAGTIGAGAG